jgi:hypothetical protein
VVIQAATIVQWHRDRTTFYRHAGSGALLAEGVGALRCGAIPQRCVLLPCQINLYLPDLFANPDPSSFHHIPLGII